MSNNQETFEEIENRVKAERQLNLHDLTQLKSKTHVEMESIIRSNRNTTRLFLGIMAVLLVAPVYWMLEPDPLTVTYVEGDGVKSKCVNGEFEFRRYVLTTKQTDVYVQERWRNINGSMDVKSTMGEIVIPNTIHYPIAQDFNKVMTFKKTLPDLEIGTYVYTPWATYKVNQLVTITKPLPQQYVTVDGDCVN